MADSPRKVLEDLLRPHLPEKWALRPYMANLDALAKTTVLFHMTSIEKLPAAPMGAYSWGMAIYVISASEGGETAEDDTDDALFDFLASLEAAKIPWTRAEKGPFSESVRNLAWSFTIPFTTSKETA